MLPSSAVNAAAAYIASDDARSKQPKCEAFQTLWLVTLARNPSEYNVRMPVCEASHAYIAMLLATECRRVYSSDITDTTIACFDK